MYVCMYVCLFCYVMICYVEKGSDDDEDDEVVRRGCSFAVSVAALLPTPISNQSRFPDVELSERKKRPSRQLRFIA